MFTEKFALRTRFDTKGTICEYIASTTSFSTQEMTDYIDAILMTVAEIGIYVPDPKLSKLQSRPGPIEEAW